MSVRVGSDRNYALEVLADRLAELKLLQERALAEEEEARHVVDDKTFALREISKKISDLEYFLMA